MGKNRWKENTLWCCSKKWGRQLLRGNQAGGRDEGTCRAASKPMLELHKNVPFSFLRSNQFLMWPLITRQLCCKDKPPVIILLFLCKASCAQKGAFHFIYYHFSFECYLCAWISGSSIAETYRKAALGEGSFTSSFFHSPSRLKALRGTGNSREVARM